MTIKRIKLHRAIIKIIIILSLIISTTKPSQNKKAYGEEQKLWFPPSTWNIDDSFYRSETRRGWCWWGPFPYRCDKSADYCAQWSGYHSENCNGNFNRKSSRDDIAAMITITDHNPFNPKYGVWVRSHKEMPWRNAPTIFLHENVINIEGGAIKCSNYNGPGKKRVEGSGGIFGIWHYDHDVCLYRGDANTPLTEMQTQKPCDGYECVCAVGVKDDSSAIIGCVSTIMKPGPKAYRMSIIDPDLTKVEFYCSKTTCGHQDLLSWLGGDSSTTPSFVQPIIKVYNSSETKYLTPGSSFRDKNGMTIKATRGEDYNPEDQICACNQVDSTTCEYIGCVPIPGIMDNAPFNMVASYNMVYRQVSSPRTTESLPFHGVAPVLISTNNKPIVKNKATFTSILSKKYWDPKDSSNDIALNNEGHLYFQNKNFISTTNQQTIADCQLVNNKYEQNTTGVRHCYPIIDGLSINPEINSYIEPSRAYANVIGLKKSSISYSPLTNEKGYGITEGEIITFTDTTKGFFDNQMTAIITSNERMEPIYFKIYNPIQDALNDSGDENEEGEEEKRDPGYIEILDPNDSSVKGQAVPFYQRAGVRYRSFCYTDSKEEKWPYFSKIPKDISEPSKDVNYFYLDRYVDPGSKFSFVINEQAQNDPQQGSLDDIVLSNVVKIKGTLNNADENDIKVRRETALCPGLYIKSKDSDDQEMICLVNANSGWDFLSGRNNSIFNPKTNENPAKLCAGIPKKCIIGDAGITNIAALGVKSDSITIGNQGITEINTGDVVYASHNCPVKQASWVKTSGSGTIALRCENGLLIPVDDNSGDVAIYQDICLEKDGSTPKEAQEEEKNSEE